ncbi:MAG: DUF6932 family protein [Saprospiraceae bacterium]
MNIETNFDIRGNLMPYEKIEMSYLAFKDFFVNSFEMDSTRHQIFENYEKYTLDFEKNVTSEFKQWINGSFVSNKKNPKDIDIVNLIDYQLLAEKESIIRSKFIRDAVPKNYGIDANLLIIYLENHKLHNWTKSDLLYWSDWFSRSRMDKRQKRYPKGYIEISFEK